MFKLVIVLMLIGIVGSLLSGLFFLYRDHGAGARTVKALTLRIALSVGLFLLLLAGHFMGVLPGYSQ